VISEVISRLQAETALTDVLPAEDLETLSKGTAPKNRTVFVLPFRDIAAPNQFAAGAFRQSIEAYVIIAFLIRRYDDAKGGKRASEYEQTRDEIESALAGWQWDASEEPFELVSGQSSAFGTAATIYAQTWKTTRTLEKR
jgi:hypothetical protein